MRKFLLLFLAAGLITFSCNNNKEKSSGKKGEKDNYLNGKEGDNGDSEDSDNGNSSQWSSGDIRKFNSECAKGMENEGIGQDLIDKICPCVLEKVSNRWSSFAKADETGNTSAIAKMTEDCVSELGLGNNSNTNNSGGGWSSADIRKFQRECKEQLAGEGLDENTAAAVCDCLLGKVQRRYADYAEMDADNSEAGKKMVEDCVKNIGGGE